MGQVFGRERRFQWMLGGLIGIMAALAVGWIAASGWLDPGDKGDRTSSLVTPTLAGAGARVFAVAAQESRVDFIVRVYGLELNGVFPVQEGTITLEPVGEQLRVLVRLDIHVDAVETANQAVSDLLRGIMATGDYPLAFYVATSQTLVPVTEEPVAFELTGDLEVHNVVAPHQMHVEAQLTGHVINALATSDLDLGQHGVALPPLVSGSTTIALTARLTAYEVDAPLDSGGG